MEFFENALRQVQVLGREYWVRDLVLLLIILVLSYLPGRFTVRLIKQYYQNRPEPLSSFGKTFSSFFSALVWPFWAILLYSLFGIWVRATQSGGQPFDLLPILVFFLIYRFIVITVAELLPPGYRLLKIRRVLIPVIFLAIVLQQLGLLQNLILWLNRPFVIMGTQPISLFSILIGLIVLVIFISVSRLLSAVLRKRFLPGIGMDAGVSENLATLARYMLIGIGILTSLSTIGLDLSTLKIVLGALGVGIGFGLQNVVNNFVSGLIILIERKIKRGDIVVVGGTDGRVVQIGLRSSVVRTRSGHEIIVPNSDLVTSQVTNFNYRDNLVRVDIPVGVSYSTDPEQVKELLLAAAKDHAGVLTFPESTVRFVQYGNNSIDFELRVWINDPWKIPVIQSALYFNIWYRLKEAGIEIPFPQRDLHVRSGELKVKVDSK